jgi:hypothetical protein
VSYVVIFAIVLGVAITAVTVLAGRELLRNAKMLGAAVKTTSQRLAPLSEELQAELAVTQVEMEGLTRQVERLRDDRASRARRQQAKNLGRKRRGKRRGAGRKR